MASNCNGFHKVLKDEALQIFIDNMADFDRRFCDLMVSGRDFTLKLEVRGNKGEMIHCRVDSDSWDRPNGVERLVERKKRR